VREREVQGMADECLIEHAGHVAVKSEKGTVAEEVLPFKVGRIFQNYCFGGILKKKVTHRATFAFFP
jgi:hypothetical protein